MSLFEKYKETPSVAVFPECNFGGVEILDVIHGINDYVISCFNYGSGREYIRHHKVETTTSGRDYFRVFGRRYYLDQFMKVGG